MGKSIKLKNDMYIDQTSIKHDYIKVRQTQDQFTTTVGDMQVLFQAVDINVGNAFELLTNGKVRVKSNKIHHVKITTWIWIERHNSYAWCHLARNSNVLTSYMLPNSPSGEVWESVEMSTITPVSQGDIIYPYIYFNIGENGNSTRGGTYINSVCMIVEAID